MRSFATHRSPARWLGILLVAAFTVAATGAFAQGVVVPPDWDHYKVYNAQPKLQLGIPVQLNDQFGPSYHQVMFLDRFMNPVEKRLPEGAVFGITEPFLHYTWWTIDPGPAPNQWLVAVTNQFGDQTLLVKDPVYLLNPALKNQTGPPPVRNHYKCYLCDGQPVNKDVLLTDQFDQWGTTVVYPRYFCNPAEKIMGPPGTGQDYPIVDPNRHYVCYEFVPPDQGVFPAQFQDQFMANTIDLTPSQWLCVPSIKQTFVETRANTWGKLKTLYR